MEGRGRGSCDLSVHGGRGRGHVICLYMGEGQGSCDLSVHGGGAGSCDLSVHGGGTGGHVI